MGSLGAGRIIKNQTSSEDRTSSLTTTARFLDFQPIILHHGEQPHAPEDEDFQAPTFINTVIDDKKSKR